MEDILWYKNAGTDFNSALPLGNGNLGAMVYGTADKETIHLNDDTLWSGKKRNRNNPSCKDNYKKIRKLLMEGKPVEAEKLAFLSMTSIPKYFGAYQPLCDLYLWFEHKKNITDYKRELDISKAVMTVSYKADDINIVREYFISKPANVLVINIKADKEIGMHMNLMKRPYDVGSQIIRNDIISLLSSDNDNEIKATTYLSGRTDGKKYVMGDFLCFENARNITVFLTTDTTFRTDKPSESCLEIIENAESKSYEELKDEHIKDYRNLYSRVKLELGEEKKDIPTDERLELVKKGNKDKGIFSLYFNFGRYLMISASRKESEAMNLQGIWNNSYTPAWESNYTININTQMNYWPAECCNLSECTEPLFRLIERMHANGLKTAKQMYGCNGFVAHHCTDIWGDTAVEGLYFPSPIWPMGGAWMSLHLFIHYEYTNDIEFLKKRAYPVLKDNVIFFNEYLTEDEEGYLMSGPSLSPENSFLLENGEIGSLCMAPEMDNQILRELYISTIKAAKIIGEDKEFIENAERTLSKIRKPRINKFGGILEWNKDYEETEPGHRHMSPLFSLFPGTLINHLKTPDLAEACEKTMERRIKNGQGHIGWSCAWIICMYARLLKGEKSEEFLYNLLKNSTFSNLFNIHPPFQIDGNFGGITGISQMLMQSINDYIYILPAIPSSWNEGRFEGMRAKGGFEISVRWNEKEIKIEIISLQGNKLSMLVSGKKIETETIKGEKYCFDINKNELQ